MHADEVMRSSRADELTAVGDACDGATSLCADAPLPMLPAAAQSAPPSSSCRTERTTKDKPTSIISLMAPVDVSTVEATSSAVVDG